MGINLHLHRSVILRIDERGQQLDCVQVDNDPKALVREVRRSRSTCLWVETDEGKPTSQLLLQGEAYRVDFSTSPASVLDGEAVVARVDERVQVGGGFTDRGRGVEGCPVTAEPFLGYFERP